MQALGVVEVLDPLGDGDRQLDLGDTSRSLIRLELRTGANPSRKERFEDGQDRLRGSSPSVGAKSERGEKWPGAKRARNRDRGGAPRRHRAGRQAHRKRGQGRAALRCHHCGQRDSSIPPSERTQGPPPSVAVSLVCCIGGVVEAEPEMQPVPHCHVLGDPLLGQICPAPVVGDGQPALHFSVYILDLIGARKPPDGIVRYARTSTRHDSRSTSVDRLFGHHEGRGPLHTGWGAQLPFDKRFSSQAARFG